MSGWRDIIAVAAGGSHTLGLKSDGTVVATGHNYSKQCNVSSWRRIIAIAAGDAHSVGVKSDGTAVAVGSNSWFQCNVSKWDLLLGKQNMTLKRSPSAYSTTYTRTKGSAKYTLSCSVKDWHGYAVSGVKMELQSSKDGKKWKRYATVTTKSSGVGYKSFKSTKAGTAYYRWRLAGTTQYNSATTSKQRIM